MLAILSPAKTLDFESPLLTDLHSEPECLEQAATLVGVLRGMSESRLGALMDISPKLAVQNAERYRTWNPPFTLDNGRQALLAFTGDVYTGFDLPSYTNEDFAYAQDHIRILSGLYGVLRPLDLIQPYRLEMGTRIETKRGRDLYAFWGDSLTKRINEAVKASGSPWLVNLASKEYYSALQPRELEAGIITASFKDYRNGTYKFITLFGKRARGAMADYLVRERVSEPEELKGFRGMGYAWNEALSSGNDWVFTRDEGAN